MAVYAYMLYWVLRSTHDSDACTEKLLLLVFIASLTLPVCVV